MDWQMLFNVEKCSFMHCAHGERQRGVKTWDGRATLRVTEAVYPLESKRGRILIS